MACACKNKQKTTQPVKQIQKSIAKKAFPQGLFKKQPQGNELLYDVRFNHIFQSI